MIVANRKMESKRLDFDMHMYGKTMVHRWKRDCQKAKHNLISLLKYIGFVSTIENFVATIIN